MSPPPSLASTLAALQLPTVTRRDVLAVLSAGFTTFAVAATMNSEAITDNAGMTAYFTLVVAPAAGALSALVTYQWAPFAFLLPAAFAAKHICKANGE